MARNGMAKISKTSLDEAKGIRILSEFLESNGTIKTFFKENDRTPNHDGFFEIIGKNDEPKKQFIVQIKKVENLQKTQTGKNAGKYVKQLEASFLYYIKEKVSESPAIYFIVDVVTNRIFWLYLSDEMLMKLDFEGQNTVQYEFGEDEIASDINDFIAIMNKVSNSRNQKFVRKTAEEISEIQDSVEYINKLFNNDLEFIKDSVFPNLWRFGIANSTTGSMSITSTDEKTGKEITMTSDNTTSFCLYPQIKGQLDYGVREFKDNYDRYFAHYDLTGKISPKEYVQSCIKRIVESYMYSGDILKYFPDIALTEKLFIFVDKLESLLGFSIGDGGDIKRVKDISDAYVVVINYIHYIINNADPDKFENQLKKVLIQVANTNPAYNRRIDVLTSIGLLGCTNSFVEYYKKYDFDKIEFNINLFSIISLENIMIYLVLNKLIDRKILEVKRVWNYNYSELNKEDAKTKIDTICENWFSNLPKLYDDMYNKIFSSNKYYNKGKFEYNFEMSQSKYWLTNEMILKYDSESFTIEKSDLSVENLRVELTTKSDVDSQKGLLNSKGSSCFGNFIRKKTLYYDSLKCLLYQGICCGLQVQCEGTSVDGMKVTLFK